MSKKDGFTLIELLAVIVILAIIAIIAVPIILGIIDDAKKGALRNTAYGILKAGEVYLGNTQMISEDSDIYLDTILPEDENPLLEYKAGEIEKGRIIINEKEQTAIIAVKWKWCAVKRFEDTEVKIVSRNRSDLCTLDDVESTVKLRLDPELPNEHGWYNTNVDVYVEKIEDYYDLESYQYAISLDGGNTYSEYSEDLTSEKFTLDRENGSLVVKVMPKGYGGINSGEVFSETIKIDKTPPNAKLNINGTKGENDWYLTDVSLTDRSDDSLSGILNSNISLSSVTGETTGTDVTITAEDKAGNTAVVTKTIKIDKTDPTGSIVATGTKHASGWYTTNVSLTSSTNSDISGIKSATLSQNSVVTDTTSSGVNVTLTIKDNAGRTGTTTLNIKRDTTDPTSPQGTIVEGSITKTVNGSDAASGVAKYQYLVLVNNSAAATNSTAGWSDSNTYTVNCSDATNKVYYGWMRTIDNVGRISAPRRVSNTSFSKSCCTVMSGACATCVTTDANTYIVGQPNTYSQCTGTANGTTNTCNGTVKTCNWTVTNSGYIQTKFTAWSTYLYHDPPTLPSLYIPYTLKCQYPYYQATHGMAYNNPVFYYAQDYRSNNSFQTLNAWYFIPQISNFTKSLTAYDLTAYEPKVRDGSELHQIKCVWLYNPQWQ